MTAKKLLTLITNPEKLFLFPEQELDDLAKQYPFCQNIVLLSTFKKQWTDEKAFKRQEELAATFSIDRSFLRTQILKNGQRKFEIHSKEEDPSFIFDDTEVIEEEVFEFPSLSKLEEQISETKEIKEPIIVEQPQTAPTVEWDHISSLEEIEDVQPKPEVVVQPEIVKVPKIISEPSQIIESAPKVIEEKPSVPVVEEIIEEVQLTEEEMLLQRMKVLEAELTVIKSKLKISTPPKKQKEKAKPIPKTAKRSLEKSDTIVSETLAKILEKQGYYKRSKKMYEQLCLIFPEKSGYFAEKIKNLQDLITNKK